MKKTIAVLFTALLAVSAFAQQNIASLLSTTTLQANATNTTASGAWKWLPDQIAVVQLTTTGTGSAANTSTGTSNIVATLATSDNGTDWVAAQYTITGAASLSNTTVTAITRLTNTVGAQWVRVDAIRNQNTNLEAITRFTWTPKSVAPKVDLH